MRVSFAFGLPEMTFAFVLSSPAGVKCHLTVFFKPRRTARGRRFSTRRWGANGVIASFSGGNLTFAL